MREVLIIVEPLGKIQGYFHIVENQKMIHLNESLTKCQREIIMCKLLHSDFQGKEFDLIHIETELSKEDFHSMLFLNQFAVHCVFSLFSVNDEQPTKRARTNQFLHEEIELKTYSDLLKIVS